MLMQIENNNCSPNFKGYKLNKTKEYLKVLENLTVEQAETLASDIKYAKKFMGKRENRALSKTVDITTQFCPRTGDIGHRITYRIPKIKDGKIVYENKFLYYLDSLKEAVEAVEMEWPRIKEMNTSLLENLKTIIKI